jgi:hypothetical protein
MPIAKKTSESNKISEFLIQIRIVINKNSLNYASL